MGQMTMIEQGTMCDHCDESVEGEAVTANVQMHAEPAPVARTWHAYCVPADIALILELERIEDEANRG
jgi:hypothetical protein